MDVEILGMAPVTRRMKQGDIIEAQSGGAYIVSYLDLSGGHIEAIKAGDKLLLVSLADGSCLVTDRDAERDQLQPKGGRLELEYL